MYDGTVLEFADVTAPALTLSAVVYDVVDNSVYVCEQSKTSHAPLSVGISLRGGCGTAAQARARFVNVLMTGGGLINGGVLAVTLA
jgi:hypothetical protein